jgi:hypothetical protein
MVCQASVEDSCSSPIKLPENEHDYVPMKKVYKFKEEIKKLNKVSDSVNMPLKIPNLSGFDSRN